MKYIVKCKNGERWKIREAVSLSEALNTIANARITGSVGSKTYFNSKLYADVVQINSDGSERKPYTEAY